MKLKARFTNAQEMNNKIQFQKTYAVKDWYDNVKFMTSEELYKRVLEDSKSNYNWIAPATELIRVSNEPDFDIIYSYGIKLLVLNCFANLELKKEVHSIRKKTDNKAVHSCYNSLSNDYDAVRKIKEKYLRAVISSIVKYTKGEVRLPKHFGESYHYVCQKWEEKMFEKYFKESHIDFDSLYDELYESYDNMIKLEEEKGTFEEDDRRERENYKKFLNSLLSFNTIIPINPDFNKTNDFLNEINFS